MSCSRATRSRPASCEGNPLTRSSIVDPSYAPSPISVELLNESIGRAAVRARRLSWRQNVTMPISMIREVGPSFGPANTDCVFFCRQRSLSPSFSPRDSLCQQSLRSALYDHCYWHCCRRIPVAVAAHGSGTDALGVGALVKGSVRSYYTLVFSTSRTPVFLLRLIGDGVLGRRRVRA